MTPRGKNTDNIVFGDNSKGEVLSVGRISISQDYTISNVLHVNSLAYNLLFVSQLCEMGYDCHFTDKGVTPIRREDSSIVFIVVDTSNTT